MKIMKRKMSNYEVTIVITKTFKLPALDKESAVTKAIAFGIDEVIKNADFSTSVKKSESYNDNNN